MMCGCSTGAELPIKGPAPVSFSSYCPPPEAFADYNDFTYQTQVKPGETAFQTVARFKLSEADKNAAGRNLWNGFKNCRAKKVVQKVPVAKKPKGDAVSDILAGGF